MKFTLFLSLLFGISLTAQRDFSSVEIKSVKITDNIYMLQGAGGNIGIQTGEDGTLMIDGQFAPLSEKILAAMKEINDQELYFLINSHWHGDHTGGNENFANAGATIVAHKNVRKRLSTDQERPFRPVTKASPEAAWPRITYNEEMELHFNGESLYLIHVHNAHTDGDTYIYFPQSNVLHMGDCFFKDRFPYIDIGSGGTPDGYIKAVSFALMIADDATQIIPGHGSLSNKSDLLNFYNMLTTMKDRITKAVDDGLSEEQALKANLTKGYESWGTGFINDEKMVKTLYNYYSEK